MKEECVPEKIVKIRHATEVDIFLIEEMLKKHHPDTSDLDYNHIKLIFRRKLYGDQLNYRT